MKKIKNLALVESEPYKEIQFWIKCENIEEINNSVNKDKYRNLYNIFYLETLKTLPAIIKTKTEIRYDFYLKYDKNLENKSQLLYTYDLKDLFIRFKGKEFKIISVINIDELDEFLYIKTKVFQSGISSKSYSTLESYRRM